MIDELQVSNIALIREATRVPGPGLTVLTGCRGAGMTVRHWAPKLRTGERGVTARWREAAALASRGARAFDAPHVA